MIKKDIFSSKTLAMANTNDQPLQIAKDTIVGISLCSIGEAKGHGIYLEKSFMAELVTSGSAKTHGLKCRFGHPGIFSDGLGSFVGTFKNFRLSDDGTKALADLELSQVAKKSPHGDLYGYVLNMAESHPMHFGTSIVNHDPKFYQYQDGAKLEIASYKDYNPKEKLYMSVGDFSAADLVDEPAANESGLFSNSNNNMMNKFKSLLSKLYASNEESTDPPVAPALEAGTPKSGDTISFKDGEGNEFKLPDGEFLITSGELKDSLLIVKDGKVTEVTPPMQEGEPEKLSRETVERLPIVQQLQALIRKQEILLDKKPAGYATTVIPKSDEFSRDKSKKFESSHLKDEAMAVTKYQ